MTEQQRFESVHSGLYGAFLCGCAAVTSAPIDPYKNLRRWQTKRTLADSDLKTPSGSERTTTCVLLGKSSAYMSAYLRMVTIFAPTVVMNHRGSVLARMRAWAEIASKKHLPHPKMMTSLRSTVRNEHDVPALDVKPQTHLRWFFLCWDAR